ncbi:MAG: M81 family metallopeptidase [Planctomycetales bacterium]|nr:M81 family metallopeptidase [Planctomycetales bacterium]
MRVGIIALLHESNTLICQPTTRRHFEQDLLLTGAAIRDRLADTHHEIGGFFAGLDEAGVEAVPIFAARAVPFGTIEADTFDWLLAQLFDALGQAGTLDGVLVAPHGATVSQRHPDADGYWLGELRRQFGSQPIIGTLDPHANLSAAMVAATDALIAYRTNPHLDQRARGREAALLMARTLHGEVRPVQAACFPPLAINIERQMTSEPHLRPLYDAADTMLAEPGVLSNSILLGFPYADVAEMGSATLVVADNDSALAADGANRLGERMWQMRQSFVAQLVEIDEAIDRALASPGPACLLDMGDNVGGGSPADSTFLAAALHRRRVADSFVCLFDPNSVEQAGRAGVGARLWMTVGGKSDDQHGQPITDEFTVLGLYEGRFHEPQPRHGGFTNYDQGATAIVRCNAGLTVMLTSRRMPPFSLRQLTSCGLEPTQFRILVAKGVNAPVAAYAPICPTLIRVNTPGSTTADLRHISYQNRRRPLFPLENEFDWQPNR